MDLKSILFLSFMTIQYTAGFLYGNSHPQYGVNTGYSSNQYTGYTGLELTDFDISIPEIPDLMDDFSDTADLISGDLEKIRDCIPPIEEGLVVIPFKRSYSDGEEIQIACLEGYELNEHVGNATCQGLGIFTDHGTFMPAVGPNTCIKTPRCSAIVEEGLVVKPYKMYYELGEKISISCMEGYKLIGEQIVFTCSKDKNNYYNQMMYFTFSGKASFGFKGGWACKKIQDCPLPIHSGLIVEPFLPSYKIGEEITLSCEEGYDLVASNTSTCDETGVFDLEIETHTVGYGYIALTTTYSQPCKKKLTCKPPFHQGIIFTPTKTAYLEGEVVTVSCKTGYELTAPITSTCGELDARIFNLITGERIGHFEPAIKLNTCKRLPKCFPPLRKGMKLIPRRYKYELGEEITLACDEGYELVTDVTKRTCTRNGIMNYHRIASAGFKPILEDEICRKKPSCRAPIQLGLVLSPKKKAYDVGEIVEISCAEGYELKKTNQSLCKVANRVLGWSFSDKNAGEFSPEIDNDVCEKIRSCSLPVREGLMIKPRKAFYRIGEKISLSCEEGYELRVAPSSKCMNSGSFFSNLAKEGKFDPIITWDACRKPTICHLPEEDNLIISPRKETYHQGDEIALSCAEGYLLISPKTMMCERAAFCRGKQDVTGCFFPGVTKGICREIFTSEEDIVIETENEDESDLKESYTEQETDSQESEEEIFFGNEMGQEPEPDLASKDEIDVGTVAIVDGERMTNEETYFAET